jgi:solute carrier family 12 (sodium/potassium/chloride transporter), member 2
MRLGWVVAQAGMLQATVIIVLANSVTLLTSLSLSAITTNGSVQGGGAYYVISRNLGPQFGGAIGLLFFIAQAVATSLYVVGFAESIVNLMKMGGTAPFTGDYRWDLRVIGLGTNVLLLGVALVGVSWVAKTQVGLLVILATTIVSVLFGPLTRTDAAAGVTGFSAETFANNWGSQYIVDPSTMVQQSLFSVFSVFFPAVTGVMAGANLSGDLKNPSQSIPVGTLGAIALTFVSYVAIVWVMGASAVRCVDTAGSGVCAASNFGTAEWAKTFFTGSNGAGGLLFDNLIASSISFWGPLVYAGIFAATLSSALASLVGAPRILQALSRDRLFAFDWVYWFAQLPWPSKEAGDGKPSAEEIEEMPSPEPIRGYFLTFVIACGCVLIGELNFIAPIISQFFLLSYALVNYACVAASLSKAPGWRPKFRYYHPLLAAVGALLCIGLMFAFDWIAALIAVIIAFAVHRYLDIVEPDVNWGTASDALKYLRVMRALHGLSRVKIDPDTEVQHAKVFRPSYLAIIPRRETSPSWNASLSLLRALWRGRGLTVAAQILEISHGVALSPKRAPRRLQDDDEDEEEARSGTLIKAYPPPAAISCPIAQAREQRRKIMELLDEHCDPTADRPFFTTEAVHSNSEREGIRILMETAGVGRLRTNTLVMQWPYQDHTSVADMAQFEGVLSEALLGRHGVMVVRDEAGGLMKQETEPIATGEQTIDVWWLDWDGGLALLVPWLLKLSRRYEGAVLRVFTSGSPTGVDNDATIAANERTKGLAKLIQQLRFDAVPKSVKLNMTDASHEGIERFRNVVPGLLTEEAILAARERCTTLNEEDVAVTVASGAEEGGEEAAAELVMEEEAREIVGAGIEELSDDQRNRLVEQSLWMIRAGELVREHSSKATMVFAVFPMPRKWFPLGMETAWMDALSHSLPPTILIRGNGATVVSHAS